MLTKLLTINADAKTKKGTKEGFLTGILYLAPSDESGAINVCAHASAGCRAACLFTAGRGAMSNVRNARIRKTLWFKNDRAAFMAQLAEDIRFLCKKAAKDGMIPAVRLNGTSDLPWENLGIFEQFPTVQFYDYTKHFKRMFSESPAQNVPNYHLTFSRSETNDSTAQLVAQTGKNVAVVFSSKNYPATFYGLPVIDGDKNDLRFLDPRPCVVGLYAKGLAKKDASGFVVQA